MIAIDNIKKGDKVWVNITNGTVKLERPSVDAPSDLEKLQLAISELQADGRGYRVRMDSIDAEVSATDIALEALKNRVAKLEEQTGERMGNQAATISMLIGRLAALESSRPTPAHGWRLLEGGELIESGDEIRVGDHWEKASSGRGCVGNGIVRRPF